MDAPSGVPPVTKGIMCGHPLRCPAGDKRDQPARDLSTLSVRSVLHPRTSSTGGPPLLSIGAGWPIGGGTLGDPVPRAPADLAGRGEPGAADHDDVGKSQAIRPRCPR